jgi:hypothetical protein
MEASVSSKSRGRRKVTVTPDCLGQTNLPVFNPWTPAKMHGCRHAICAARRRSAAMAQSLNAPSARPTTRNACMAACGVRQFRGSARKQEGHRIMSPSVE